MLIQVKADLFVNPELVTSVSRRPTPSALKDCPLQDVYLELNDDIKRLASAVTVEEADSEIARVVKLINGGDLQC